jgi:hypothetical protein
MSDLQPPTTLPSTYKNTFFKRTATGILPFVKCGKFSIQTLTWEDLTRMLLTVRDEPFFQLLYILYLYTVEINSKYSFLFLLFLNLLLKIFATYFVGCSPFRAVTLKLIDNASVIVASSNGSTGSVYGRTEIITAQSQIDIIPCVARIAPEDGYFSYYAACAMGSYQTNSEYPAHVLSINATYYVQC